MHQIVASREENPYQRAQTSRLSWPSVGTDDGDSKWRKRASRLLEGVNDEHVVNIYKDQVKGRVEEVKATVKEATGKLVGDKTLEAKGNIEKNLGKVQSKLGDLKEEVRDSKK
jgi:uncharacterized protein YjbJ (UPF0337 family)